MTWEEIINDTTLQNLPFKIETNKFGQILTSPATNRHGSIQFDVGRKIDRQKRNGTIIVECSIDTADGVKVAEVVWASDKFMEEFGDTTLNAILKNRPV